MKIRIRKLLSTLLSTGEHWHLPISSFVECLDHIDQHPTAPPEIQIKHDAVCNYTNPFNDKF